MKKTVLVIDDDREVRESLCLVLESLGYEPAVAEDGIAGIEVSKRIQPDLILTDILMPRAEGIETILKLKRELPDVKIVAMSGGARLGPESYLELAKHVGADYAIEKPFDVDRLIEALGCVLTD